VTGVSRDFVTVVSGLPRSGTSLAMQLVAAGGIPPLTDHQRAPDADNPRGYFEFEAVKQLRSDRSWFADARGRSVKIIHMLLTELPDDVPCRVLFMRRDIGEVVRSQRVMLERSGKPGGALTSERLGAVYESQLAGVARWLAGRPAFRVLDVPYAGLIADPVPLIAGIDAFLGGGLDTDAMAGAVDPSLYRNRAGS
jgi:hypothetical protein